MLLFYLIGGIFLLNTMNVYYFCCLLISFRTTLVAIPNFPSVNALKELWKVPGDSLHVSVIIHRSDRLTSSSELEPDSKACCV